jgi:hypothetical protein
MTREEWQRRQDAYEESLRARGVADEMTLARSCWYCRDTSQCDETCFRVESETGETTSPVAEER